MDESRILDLFFKRDERALSITAEVFGSCVMKISRNILKDEGDSEENANDTYMSLWNSIPPNRPDSMVAYISKIARNLAINKLHKRTALKRQAATEALSLDELDECTPSNLRVESQADAKLLSGAITDFLRGEKAQARNIFLRRYFFCDSIKDVSQLLNISESKVKSSLMRTRNKLREHLVKEGFEFE